MYLTFFGLNEKPFAITPDPRYLFLSERHAEALAHLLYGINEAGGFVQLTGEVGTGKTTMIRSLLARTPQNAEVALILNPRMTAREFLASICQELHIPVTGAVRLSIKELVDALGGHLLGAHGAGRRVVLVVDEAQNLAPDLLEQVRLLTNLETNTRKLLQIILIGQPELRALLDRNELRQLAQRITGRYHLCPLTAGETAAYVRHRLKVAGATSDIFAPTALQEVYRLSGGVPRLINVLCDRALLGAYTQDRHRVTRGFVRRAAAEVFGRSVAPWWTPWAAGVATAVVCASGLLLWRFAPAASAARAVPAAGGGNPVLRPAGTGAAAGTPAAQAGSSPGPAGTAGRPAPVPLGTLLAQRAADATAESAFARLLGLWGAHFSAGADPCTQAADQGLSCYAQKGSFAQLRLFNRPAILVLNDDTGTAHHVVLTALDDERARIEVGGTTHSVSIAELSRYWFGDFILLWQPPTRDVRVLAPGMRGAEVLQLRQDLQRLAGGAGVGGAGAGRAADADAGADLYDGALSQLVRDFQRRHRLSVDGVAGVQTLVVLNSATAKPDSPLLSALQGG